MSSKRTADWLRYVPPVAALGTAFVLQTIIVTDLLGGALAARFGSNWAYLPGVLFGLSVASCAEGGAAYLMDLYDKHLLARDSVWILRVAMVVYVAGSGLAIHWWAAQRGLPPVLSWILSGMSASALFLWSRGARWRNREAMRTAGQIDPALPRLPLSAKVLHPVRWAVTLFLISWQPVATTEQARVRYQQYRERRTGRTAQAVQLAADIVAGARREADTVRAEAEDAADAVRQMVAVELSARAAKQLSASADAAAVLADAKQQAVQIKTAAEQDADAVRGQARLDADAVLSAAHDEAEKLTAEAARLRDDAERAVQRSQQATDIGRPVRAVRAVQAVSARADVSVEQLADTLDEQFPDRVPGRPSAIPVLKQVYGSCSNDRAIAAIEALRVRRGVQREPTDRERLHVITGRDSMGATA